MKRSLKLVAVGCLTLLAYSLGCSKKPVPSRRKAAQPARQTRATAARLSNSRSLPNQAWWRSRPALTFRKNLVGNRNQNIISGLMVDIKGSQPATNERGFHLPTASTGMGF